VQISGFPEWIILKVRPMQTVKRSGGQWEGKGREGGGPGMIVTATAPASEERERVASGQ